MLEWQRTFLVGTGSFALVALIMCCCGTWYSNKVGKTHLEKSTYRQIAMVTVGIMSFC